MRKIIFDKEARDEMKSGIKRLVKTVGTTMGSNGGNAMYRRFGSPTITNDGVSIARMVEGDNDYQDQAIEVIRQASEKTNDEAGDGTSTSIVLAGSMFELGCEQVDNGVNSMLIKKQMHAMSEKVIEKLKEVTVKVEGDQLLHVAEISVESKEVGDIVAKAVIEAGKDGIISAEEASVGNKIEIEKTDGMEFPSGWLSPYMVTNHDKMAAIVENVPILVTDKTFSSNSDLDFVMKYFIDRGVKAFLLICEDVVGELRQTIINTRVSGSLNVIVVQAPMASRKEFLADVAALTGAKAITVDSGIRNINTGYFGSARKITVTKDSTTIIGGGAKPEALEEYIKALQAQKEDAEFPHEKEKLQERIAKMIGSVTVIKVGAETEADMKYWKLKIDDAVAAVRAASEEGIVSGGGMALMRIAESIDVEEGDIGGKIVLDACKAPFKQIVSNAGKNPDEVWEKLSGKPNAGYDVKTGHYTDDMIKHGIVDPVKVTRCALKNATSSSGILITTDKLFGDFEDAK